MFTAKRVNDELCQLQLRLLPVKSTQVAFVLSISSQLYITHASSTLAVTGLYSSFTNFLNWQPFKGRI